MNTIRHHVDEDSLAAFANGSLSYPFAVVVAAHLAVCAECRAAYGEQIGVAGAALDDLPGKPVPTDLKSGVMDRLDENVPATAPRPRLPAPYPRPLSEFFGEAGPKWKAIGMGGKQSILWEGRPGSLRLLYIPKGQAVPDHGHKGPEFTLVLEGSYQAGGRTYAAGDLEIADQDVEHTPVAGDEMPCICLAATDAPLRFNALIPRILQPLLRI